MKVREGEIKLEKELNKLTLQLLLTRGFSEFGRVSNTSLLGNEIFFSKDNISWGKTLETSELYRGITNGQSRFSHNPLDGAKLMRPIGMP